MTDDVSKGAFGMGALDMGSLAAMGAAYQRKLLEFGQANAKSAVDYATALSGCRSPADFMTVTQDYTRQQLEAAQQQTKELLDLGKGLHTTTNPIDPVV